jgi:hypothetical protein
MLDLSGVMLSKGMSYELYWYGDMDAVLSYYEKIKYEQKSKEAEVDTIAWLHGRYVLEAIGAVLNKQNKYPTQPLSYETAKSEEDKIVEQYNKLKAWSGKFTNKSGNK